MTLIGCGWCHSAPCICVPRQSLTGIATWSGTYELPPQLSPQLSDADIERIAEAVAKKLREVKP